MAISHVSGAARQLRVRGPSGPPTPAVAARGPAPFGCRRDSEPDRCVTPSPAGASTRRMHPLLKRAVIAWLPVATLAVLFAGLLYVVAQQALRTGANDPQIQLAQDAAAALDAGAVPSDVVPAGDIDIARSLAVFTIVTDGSGAILAGNATLDGSPPTVPSGILHAARAGATDKVTWQPRDGVRVAQATIGWQGGAVTVGRSLFEIERREDAVMALCAAGLVATLLALAAASLVVAWLGRPPPTEVGTAG